MRFDRTKIFRFKPREKDDKESLFICVWDNGDVSLTIAENSNGEFFVLTDKERKRLIKILNNIPTEK